MNKDNFIIQVAVVLLLLTMNYSCSSDTIPATYASTGVCFETDVLPIVVSNCSQPACHNSNDRADGYDFTSYDGIMEAVKPFNTDGSEFYESIVTTDLDDIMPPPPNTALDSTQISIIADWINKGAPNTFDCNISCDTLVDVSFSNHVLPVLNTYCNGCHAGNAPQGGIDQSTWVAVKATVDDGSFLGSITHDINYVAMPLYASKMPPCEILLIETWVTEGANDN